MGLLKQFRLRSRHAPCDSNRHEERKNGYAYSHGERFCDGTVDSPAARDFTARLPADILKTIFGFICPHTSDVSFDMAENADVGDGCMLCDLRDLANCAKVRRAWYQPAQEQLYFSIRIDPVHYCELEDDLAEKRRRKSRHGHVEDAPAVRLRLLADTLRGRQWLGSQVRFLKLPYMTRETCKADLARAVSACPQLQYVDLSESFYSGDPTCAMVRQELQTHCRDLRQMKYYAGSEQYFHLTTQGHWQNIEVLEVKKLRTDALTFRMVTASLPVLRELRVTDVPCFSDHIFNAVPNAPGFPSLQSLILESCPDVTAAGLTSYLERSATTEKLINLSLTGTGVLVPDLHSILRRGTHLLHLTFAASVTDALPLEPIEPLTSRSLQKLHYEITPTNSANLRASPLLPVPTDSYYAYLASSLQSNSLPALRVLYVRDTGLPDALLLSPPRAAFASATAAQPRGFAQPLEVYTKALDETEWVFNSVAAPSDNSRPTSLHGGRRPLSTFATDTARRSVIIGDGVGGFLAVPSGEDGYRGATLRRPASSGDVGARVDEGKKKGLGLWGHRREASHGSARDNRASRADLWR